MLSGHRFPESLLKVVIDTIILTHIAQLEFFLSRIYVISVAIECVYRFPAAHQGNRHSLC